MTSCWVFMHDGVKFSLQHRFSIARMDLSNSLSTQWQYGVPVALLWRITETKVLLEVHVIRQTNRH